MRSPREISSARQGALTPTTARLVSKAGVRVGEPGATPRSLDPAAVRTPWANLTVDTAAVATAVDEVAGAASGAVASGPLPVGAAAALPMRSGASTLAPAPPGVLPERYTADLQHWQSPADLPERRLMVQRIIAMTRSRRLGPLGVGAQRCGVPADRTPSLAKRIELSLYSRAASFNEYRDLNTLRRRLQSLVSLSYHEAAGARRAVGTEDPSALGKRSASAMTTTMTPFGVSRLQLKKRPRVAVDAAPVRAAAEEKLFFVTNEDVLRAIFSFLSGSETARLSAINRFAARVLPRCVTSLTVDTRALQTSSMVLLARFPNLEELSVTNVRSQSAQTASAAASLTAAPKDEDEEMSGSMSLHAWGCRELELSHDNAGERVVAQLAEALERGAGRRLRALRLVSVFSNTCRVNALHLLCAALVKGACPDLEDLLLGGNALADVGAVDVAWLLRAGSLPKLARLDLRRNYIGESGLRRIMAALASGRCAQLQYLCMGGNIITDDCVAPVVALLSHSRCPRLRFLGLEDNFLSAQGVHAVIDAAVAGGMMPKLHHVACDAGSGPAPAPAPAPTEAQPAAAAGA